MTKYIPMWAYALAFLGILSCSDSNEIVKTAPVVNQVTLKDPVNNFIWKGMNSWYNWQLDSPNLADSKGDTRKTLLVF